MYSYVNALNYNLNHSCCIFCER